MMTAGTLGTELAWTTAPISALQWPGSFIGSPTVERPALILQRFQCCDIAEVGPHDGAPQSLDAREGSAFLCWNDGFQDGEIPILRLSELSSEVPPRVVCTI